jgi:hypothetical protein
MTATWGPPGPADYGDGHGHGRSQAATRSGPGPQAGMPSSATCWLCGTQMPTAVMVADGGAACSDVRWYCQDAQQCTWRWTSKSSLTR